MSLRSRITINLLVVYMARDLMIFMGENPLREPLEGVGPENREFFGPLFGNERSECDLDPKKSRFSGPTHSNGRSNGFAPHQNH